MTNVLYQNLAEAFRGPESRAEMLDIELNELHQLALDHCNYRLEREVREEIDRRDGQVMFTIKQAQLVAELYPLVTMRDYIAMAAARCGMTELEAILELDKIVAAVAARA
jgi:hypothetical protein